MDFENRTTSPATLIRSSGPGTRMYGSLVTRIRHQLTDDGTLVPPPPELALTDVRREPLETPYGIFPCEEFVPRIGTDLIVLATAVSDVPVTEMTVQVSAGPYDVAIRVIGDRVWQKSADGSLVPGPPATFTTMPLRYQNALGGTLPTEYGDFPDPSNPVGKGFYMHESEALDQPLPNLEDPAAPIRAFNDRPAVVGLGPYPREWWLRLTKVLVVDPNTRKVDLHLENGFYDVAHPSLSGQRLAAGDVVTLKGVSVRGPIAFSLPECPFGVEVSLGRKTTRLTPLLEEVLVDANSGLVDLTYRKLFKYEMVPNQKRTTVLLSGSEGQ